MTKSWIAGILLAWVCTAQTNLKTPEELESALGAGLKGNSEAFRPSIVGLRESGKVPIEIEPPESAGDRTATGSVSARDLAHKPPKGASKEYDRGVQAWKKGQIAEAVHHLAEAFRLDPNLIEAEADLAAVYVTTGKPELALELLEHALAVKPNWALLYGSKAAALMSLDRPKEAEQAARRAVRLNPGWIEANYILGVAMLMLNQITPETAEHLTIATRRYPRAGALLAEVQEALGAGAGKVPD
jgi:Tfp pilus assembly protein PilF